MNTMIGGGAVSGTQKAAALLLSIGVENSSKVLQYLGEADLERVMFSISEGGAVPPNARKMALEEAFIFSQAGHNMSTGGIEYTRQLLARSVGPRRGADILDRITARQQLSSFEILRNADPVRMADLLAEEHPQTIALVLSYLDAKQAADILTNMPSTTQVDVTLRLSTMDRVSPQVVQVVEQSLKHKLSGVISEADFRSTGGVSFLVKMLNQVDRGVQKNIFDALSETNPVLVEDIRANMFTFDDLTKLDDRSMQRILRDVDKADLALAMKGTSEKLQDLILRNLSTRAAESLRDEVDILGPQLAKNVYEAQRKIVDIVRNLEEQEEIVIAGSGGEDSEVIV